MDVKDAIETRRAYRALTKVEITQEIISQLGHAAQLAPSCFNKQPWRYIFLYNEKLLEEFQVVFPVNNSWAFSSSLIIAVVSEVSLDCSMKDGREYYLYDTGIATGFILLRATELGLVAHPMAGYDHQKAKKILCISDEMALINIIAVGKHDENYKNVLPEEKISAEDSRPARKTFQEFLFINKYGNSFHTTYKGDNGYI